MADEAILRIKIQEEAGGTRPLTPPAGSAPAGPAGVASARPAFAAPTEPSGGTTFATAAQRPSAISGPGFHQVPLSPTPSGILKPILPDLTALPGDFSKPRIPPANTIPSSLALPGPSAGAMAAIGSGQRGSALSALGLPAGTVGTMTTGATGVAVMGAMAVAVNSVKDAAAGAARGLKDLALAATSPETGAPQFFSAVSGQIQAIHAMTGEFNPLTRAAAEVADAFGAVTRNLSGMADRLAPFSAPISREIALNEARMLLGDVRRAAVAGETLSAYLRAQGQLERDFEELKIRFITNVGPLITRAVENISGILDFLFGTKSDAAAGEILGVWEAIQNSTAGDLRPAKGVQVPDPEGPV